MAIVLSLLPTADSHQTLISIPNFKPKPKTKTQTNFNSSPFPLSRFNPSIFNNSPPSFSTSIAYGIQNLPRSGAFLPNEDLPKLQFLDNFTYYSKLAYGHLTIRVMKDWELDMTVELLAESFAESMMLPTMYLTVLGFLIKQYLVEKRGVMPHAVTLIGFYRGEGGDAEEELAGTVELSFDEKGANASPPSPVPPKDCPYICNMTVKKAIRRKGIGWHLLKASEELISHMSSSRMAYLHCRMIDSAPFSMYKKAGYEVVKTDSFLTLLMLQRRKHLMRKELPALTSVSFSDEEHLPLTVRSESECLLSEQVPVLHVFIDKEAVFSIGTIPN